MDFKSDNLLRNKLIKLIGKLPGTFPANAKDYIKKYRDLIISVLN